MKIKKGFRLRKVCGNSIVVSEGVENIDFSKLINLNESGTDIWERIADKDFDEKGIAAILTENYDIDEATATNDASAFVRQLREAGVIED